MHKFIHNVETGKIEQVPLSSEEIIDLKVRQMAALEIKEKLDAENQRAVTAKAALLTKLGITEEEAKLLLS